MQSQMVLFIDHHPNLVLYEERRARAGPRFPLQASQLFTDEMTLVQQLPLGAVHPVEVEGDGRREMVGRRRGFADAVQHRRPIRSEERRVGKECRSRWS